LTPLPLPDAPLARLGTPDGLAPLATVLAHRLRSLVGSIQVSAELLVDTVPSDDDRDLALRILEGGAAIERILADLISFGHRPEPVLLPVPVADVVGGLLDVLAPAPGRVRLALDLPPDYRHAADPVLLRQALIILLQNAFEAAPPASPVDLRVGVDGGLVVEVQNDGHVERPDAMFEPFYTTKTDRLGLGLAIARRAVETQGGTLRASAEAGRVTVSLCLPTPTVRAPRALPTHA
jgi:signal transduction histidine kinase